MTVDNINNYRRVLQDNNNSVNDSFVYFLDQENSFSERAFWQLYNSIIGLTEKPHSSEVDREFARILCRVQAHILHAIIQHFLPDASAASNIHNLPLEAIEAYMERLEYAIDSYFTGLTVNEKQLEQADGLRNPNVHSD